MLKLKPPRFPIIALAAIVISCNAAAQSQSESVGHSALTIPSSVPAADLPTGPNGGRMNRANGIQVETVITHGFIRLFVFDLQGRPVAVDRGMGATSLRIAGAAKRYRYNLLPDGNRALSAFANLSKFAGRQVELKTQLVSIVGTSGQTTIVQRVTVPPNEAQLASEAIAQQKICPVSGRRLGSMGQPVGIDIDAGRVYVCCARCADDVRANPDNFAAGKQPFRITSASRADEEHISRQVKCPVMNAPLGSMGKPVKVTIGQRSVFLCCRGCIAKVQADPFKYLSTVYGNGSQSSPQKNTNAPAVPVGGEEIRLGVFRVTDADAPFVAGQKRCPVTNQPLDSMGGPFKVNAAGRAIYICCPPCAEKIKASPDRYIGMLADQGFNAPEMR